MEALVERPAPGATPATSSRCAGTAGARPGCRWRPSAEQAGQGRTSSETRIDDALECQSASKTPAPLVTCAPHRPGRPRGIAAASVAKDPPRRRGNSSRPEGRISPFCGTTESSTSLDTCRGDAQAHSARRRTCRMRCRRDDPRVDAARLPQRLHVGDHVVGPRRTGAGSRAERRTRAPRGGRRRGVRSELPIAACRAGQSSAPAPVPRWSNTTTR